MEICKANNQHVLDIAWLLFFFGKNALNSDRYIFDHEIKKAKKPVTKLTIVLLREMHVETLNPLLLTKAKLLDVRDVVNMNISRLGF